MTEASKSEKNGQQSDILGPHRQIQLGSERERFLADLFDRLWNRYRNRVTFVQTYEQVIRDAGASFVNDHIAFRTLAINEPLSGIASLSRVFEALGYAAANCYHFQDKHLSAIHFQHTNPGLPKLFISELRTWELASTIRRKLLEGVVANRPPIDDDALTGLFHLDDSAAGRDELMTRAVAVFEGSPWNLVERQLVEAVNQVSQYAAWVLVHGYNVNHFTSLINSHQVDSLNDIDKTIGALKQAGVPMKASVEGEVGSKLRQSATEAVTIDVDVAERGTPTTMPWTYAYFELAERGEVVDPQSGKPARFEGFLGPQATNLFEMTRVK